MGAESGMNSSVRDDRVALSDGAKALWGKTNRIDDSEWLPLYVHMVDSAAMASKIWDTWVPQGTKAVIVGDLGNDEVLARKLMIFMAGIHDIGKATPVFQAKSITFGPEAGSFAWKAERAGLPMIAGLRGTNHPTHPIAGEIILEGYLLRVRGWERKAARQYACVVGGHHGTPPDKSKIDEEKNRKTNVGLDSEAWVSTQDELIDFVANIAGIEEKEWEDLSERRFSVQSAVLMTGLVIMADWIASNSDEDMFPLVRTEPWADEDEDFFFSESGEEDDIQSWSGLRIRADRAWSCVQLPHAWVPEGIPSSCQDLFATRFTLPEGAKVRPVQEEAVRIARDTRQPGLMVIEAPMGEGKTEAALAAAEILAQRTGRGGVCVALPTMATTDAMFTRVRRWLEALPSCDFDNEKTVWLAHGKAQLNNDFRGIIAASHRRFSSVDQDDVKQESSQNRKKKQIDVPPETVVSDWLWGRKKGALANFLVCTVDQVLMSALQMKHVVLRQLAMANKVVIIDECHAYDAYMQEYLKMALEWLGGYRTPVILLSATLPECQRNAMVEAYLKGWCDTEPRKASKVSILEQLRARNASNTHHINHTANSEMSCEKGTAEKLRLISNAYPLLTYTDGHETKHADVKPSGRSMKVQCRLVDDDDTALLDLMDALLVDGGCIGVICDTVGRAQHAAELLGNHCGRDCVRLTHSRFMDIDRMSNERELRDLLGPDATIGNGKRPGKLVVVGTQVLEQSLDIDFDALVTDIAPVDLIMQRLGRVHRHRRGDGECDRPVSLQTATCYIRGVEAWNNEGPKFSRGADSVYDAAALMESLAVLDLTAAGASCAQQLPQDIARTVRSAYGNDPHGFLPHMWLNDQNRFVGPVQAMTWQSRRVRLVPSEDNARIIGIMSCYGDVVAPYNTDVFEKMTAWRSSVTQQKKLGLPAPPHMPVVHDAGKALWRGLEPILCASDEGDSRPGLIRWLEEIRTEILESEKHVLDLVTIHAQGMTYGTQSSVFETGIDDTLSLNSVMFRHDYSGIASVLDVVKCTDGAVLALSQFVRNLRAASGDKGKSTETAEQVREWAYADLDGLFRDELAAFDETQDPIEYANAWKDEIHRRLLQMGWEYLDQSSVPVFGEHESGVVGVMGASRAQLLFQSKLNKELGFLEEKDASRPNKGGM